jgi:biopolymer transport protein ExbD
MKVHLQGTKRARTEMLPLIDIVFLLLVFFIYAMLSMTVHRGLPVVLPSSTTAEINNHLILSVTVQADGSIYLDQERISLRALRESLMEKASGEKEAGVLLFADKNLPYKRLFRVMDEIRLAGLSRISLQAEFEE